MAYIAEDQQYFDKYGRFTGDGSINSQLAQQARAVNDKHGDIYQQQLNKTGSVSNALDFVDTYTNHSQVNKDYEQMKARAIEDPWSFYRSSSADKLAKTSANDPTEKYMSRLEQLQSGDFGTGDTSYDWRFQQGQKALERSQASRGLLGSGNAAHELQEYGQGAASQEYAAEFQRTLQGLQGVSSAYDASQQRLMQMAGVNVDPGGMANRATSIAQSQIGAAASVASANASAGASMARTAEDGRQFDTEVGFANLYDQGVGQGLAGFESFSQQL